MHKGFEAIDSLDQQIQKGCLEGTVYLRMTFPAVVATASPLSVLPQFVEVLGKKIDKIQAELDCFSCHDHVNQSYAMLF